MRASFYGKYKHAHTVSQKDLIYNKAYTHDPITYHADLYHLSRCGRAWSDDLFFVFRRANVRSVTRPVRGYGRVSRSSYDHGHETRPCNRGCVPHCDCARARVRVRGQTHSCYRRDYGRDPTRQRPPD